MDDKWYIDSIKSDKKLHKLKTGEELLNHYITELIKAREHWFDLFENGGNDPFWCDGINLNLVRNHVLYYRKHILKLCEFKGYEVPVCCFEQIPPEVNPCYMAKQNPTNEHQKKRYERIQQSGTTFTFEKPYVPLTAQLGIVF